MDSIDIALPLILQYTRSYNDARKWYFNFTNDSWKIQFAQYVISKSAISQ